MIVVLLWLLLVVFLLIAFSRKIDNLYDGIILLRPLSDKFRKSIEQHNGFYQRLPAESKKMFEKKVKQFIFSKKFIPRNLSEVTDEMKALIASAAVQLTFGLPGVSLKHFDRILVYADDYYSEIGRQYHKGEVNPRLRAIVVSWKSFVEGYAHPHNGINLGLHEMAHALKLENVIRNGEHHFFELQEYTKWIGLAGEVIRKIRNYEDTLFRQYAAVDEDEFFAACIEIYFEQPHQMLEIYPVLYKTLSNLLCQDLIQLYSKSVA